MADIRLILTETRNITDFLAVLFFNRNNFSEAQVLSAIEFSCNTFATLKFNSSPTKELSDSTAGVFFSARKTTFLKNVGQK